MTNHLFKSSLNKGFKTQFSGKNFKYYTLESIKCFKQEKEKSLCPPKWKLRYLCPQNICNSARLFPQTWKTPFKGKQETFNFTYIAQYMKNKICASFANLLNSKKFRNSKLVCYYVKCIFCLFFTKIEWRSLPR